MRGSRLRVQRACRWESKRVMRIRLAFAFLLACNPVFKDVPLSTAALGPPITDVRPRPDMATVVFAMDGPLDGGQQAVTIVRDGGVYVGQLTTRSLIAVAVPPGPHA